MQNRCTTCPRPVPDTGFGCAACGTDLAQRLDQLSAVLPELVTTIARQDRIGSGGARPAGAEIPLPFRDGVAEKGYAIRGELTTWARVVHDETGRYLAGRTDAALAWYLGEACDWARYRPLWPEFHAALRPLYGRLLGLIDRPEEKSYLGPCNTRDEETDAWCTADVLAERGAAWGKCRACGAEHDAVKAREWLLGMLDDQLFLLPELAGIMQRQGVKVAYSTLTMYARQKRFLPHADDTRSRPLYRLGDVVVVVKEAEEERRKREEMRLARYYQGVVA